MSEGNKCIQYTGYTSGELYRYIFEKRSDLNCYVAYIRGKRCDCDENLFKEFSSSLQFPDYFGENWAAFDECMGDMSWLQVQKCLIVIDNGKMFLQFDKKNEGIYLKYLNLAFHERDFDSPALEIVINM